MHTKFTTATEAVKNIKSFDRVFIHGAAMTPQTLVKAMVARAEELREVEVVHIHTEGNADYAKPEFAKNFRTHAFFVGGNVRHFVQQGSADYVPVF